MAPPLFPLPSFGIAANAPASPDRSALTLTACEVQSVLEGPGVTKATGPDEIPAKLVIINSLYNCTISL